MQMQILPSLDVSYLDTLLLKDGVLQNLSAKLLKTIPHLHLRLWCHKYAIYGLPSVELIDLINAHIGGENCIEIGSGCGVFGRVLNIPATDSFIQATPEMIAQYKMLGQPVVEYGANVLKFEAEEAIDNFKPHTVFGSWVTQYVSPLATTAPAGGGSIYGLKETSFIHKIKKYIVYGNELIHGAKELFSMRGIKVTKIKDPEIMFSRASAPEENCLYVIEHDKQNA